MQKTSLENIGANLSHLKNNMDTFVKHISSSNEITVFWGYEHYSLNTEYSFYINDVCVGKTTHTHFTFNDLITKHNEKYNIMLCNKVTQTIQVWN